jgi:hypothetical protein
MNEYSRRPVTIVRREPVLDAASAGPGRPVRPWRETEQVLDVAHEAANPYLEVDVEVRFRHADGERLVRPAFWDGGSVWRVRFAPTRPGRWSWAATAGGPAEVRGISRGVLDCEPAVDEANAFYRHGFWRMSPAGSSLVHADGTPSVLVADTAWGLPWRATHDQVVEYAADRSGKGFNAVLLMTVQPDMRAVGPPDRTADEGFDVGFHDLAAGRLTRLDVGYFRYLDRSLEILADAGIAAVLQPVFQGFGWKGLDTAGTVVPPSEYARFCRYLVARYGARPVVYLVGADGTGLAPQVEAGGRQVHACDAYGQPTGLHYQPHARNDAHQDAEWLDFQWCQTGHGGEHVPERVADMVRNTPRRAVANGEPTYEHTGRPGRGTGWWQGHEAWLNLFAGGTMGVVYGAASLWQWRLHADEPGHEPYFLAPGAGWREALHFEGSTYVGLVSRILHGLPTTDMRPNRTLAVCPRVLEVPGRLVLAYQEDGGDLKVTSDAVPLGYRVLDPRTGELVSRGVRSRPEDPVPDAGGHPRLYICEPAGRSPRSKPPTGITEVGTERSAPVRS